MDKWTEIEKAYVEGKLSLQALAQKCRVSYSALSKRAARDKWSEKRRAWRRGVRNEAARQGGERSGEKLASLMRATELAMETVLRALEDDEQFKRYLVTVRQGSGVSQTEERLFDKIDTKALKELTGVLRDLTALARDFYGIRTPSQSVAEKIALEKLELERKRTEAKLPENEDREILVTMSGDAEELGK